MEYIPPIQKRTSKELHEIIENYERWEKDAVIQATNELVERGETIQSLTNRKLSNEKFLVKTKKIKNEASYNQVEMAFIFFFATFIIMFSGLNYVYPEKGYTKKNRQRLILSIASGAFWFGILFLSLKFGLT